MTIEFADGLANVTIMGGVARLEFFAFRHAEIPTETAEGTPPLTKVPAAMVVLPLEGLVAAARNLEEVKNRLLRDGVVRERHNGEAPSRGAAAPKAEPPSVLSRPTPQAAPGPVPSSRASRSPNFR